MIVMAILEVTGVSSIMPFMAVLSDPDIVATNKWLNWVYVQLEFSNTNHFLCFLGVAVLIALIINNSFTAYITWRIFKFTWGCNHSLSERLLRTYLFQPYHFFLNRNSADLGKNILDEVRMFVTFILLKLIMILKNTIISLSIISLLFIFDPLLAIIVSLVLSSAYGGFFAFINRTLNRIGKERAESNEMRFKIVNEALNGIKELKVLRREHIFLRNFSTHSLRFANSQAMKNSISKLPKYALEVIAFGGILLIVLYFLITKQNMDHVVPLLSLYTFAAYRLMPALQAIFTGVSEIRYTIPALDLIECDLKKKTNWQEDKIEIKPLKIKNKFELKNIEYTYNGMEKAVIRNFNLIILSNTTVGIAGPTGSGKTTIIDIILGLLQPDKGHLIVDDQLINNGNLVRWQKNIGYVSQDIFIYDDTIANNILFGLSENNIDRKLIIRAAKIANLHEFIINSLPNGYDTVVGDRGVRLSGGQRQRIGIARAVFHDPDTLIFDEATSALDGVTESAVMTAIDKLAHKKTIIMIAHRLTTLKNCDQIYLIDKGAIIDQGTFDELMLTNTEFRNMTKSVNS